MTLHYLLTYMPNHPHASKSGCVYQHVLVAERALGRLLPPGATVHHVDEDWRNNTPSNLVICQDAAYHKLLHVRARIVKAGGNPDTQKLCATCHQLCALAEFNRSSSSKGYGLQPQCRACSKAYAKHYVRPSEREKVACR